MNSKETKSFQRDKMLPWLNSLSQKEKQALRDEFRGLKNKEMNLSIDGIDGSTTKFLRQKIAEHHAGAITEALKKMTAEGVITSGFLAQSGGKSSVLNIAQAGAKWQLSENTSLNLGVSLRPDSQINGVISNNELKPQNAFNPLEFNLQNGGVKLGLSTWIGNHNYQRKVFSNTTILSCGCTGAAEKNSVTLRDGVLSPFLNEVSIAGVHGEKIFAEKTFVRAGAGVPVNNHSLQTKPTAEVAVRHKISAKTEASASVVAQSGQVLVNAGMSHKITDKTKLSVNAHGDFGREHKVGAELRVEHQVTKKLAAALSGVVQKDFKGEQSGWGVRPALQYQVNDRFSVGAYGVAGKEGGKKNIGGFIGGSFSF